MQAEPAEPARQAANAYLGDAPPATADPHELALQALLSGARRLLESAVVELNDTEERRSNGRRLRAGRLLRSSADLLNAAAARL